MKKLGFGCMRFPLLDSNNQKEVDIDKVIEMVDTFLARGFTYFDTAYMYHEGESERIVKKVLVDRHPRDSYVLANKLPTMMLKTKEDMERIFNDQLEKTGVEYFDYYLLHCLNKNLYKIATDFGAFDFVLQKKVEGKVNRFGFSFHDTADVLDQILTEHPEVEFVQLQINYLDWEDEGVQSRKCLECAIKHNKEVIVMEPVKGGGLVNLPTKAVKLFKELDGNMSVPSWAIRFAGSCKNVFMVLSGMSNMDQLLDNISYMEDFVPLTEAEKNVCYSVAEVIKSSQSVPCTSCRYCVKGCPVGIAIPEYFELYNRFLKKEEIGDNEYIELVKKSGKICDCVGCKMCERSCPQHIDIVDFLKDAENALENKYMG